jgi:hypothetical protein
LEVLSVPTQLPLRGWIVTGVSRVQSNSAVEKRNIGSKQNLKFKNIAISFIDKYYFA